jgi:mannose-6-phosphate isomerase-like protein (cupin superfamily)
MTTSERPAPVGQYHLLQDFQCPTSSIRVIKMTSESEAVGGHVHHRSMQIYVALEGAIRIDVDGLETDLEPYGALTVWPGSRHMAWPRDGAAILMNISIPPLAADDQHPTDVPAERPDMRLPGEDSEVDD